MYLMCRVNQSIYFINYQYIMFSSHFFLIIHCIIVIIINKHLCHCLPYVNFPSLNTTRYLCSNLNTFSLGFQNSPSVHVQRNFLSETWHDLHCDTDIDPNSPFMRPQEMIAYKNLSFAGSTLLLKKPNGYASICILYRVIFVFFNWEPCRLVS